MGLAGRPFAGELGGLFDDVRADRSVLPAGNVARAGEAQPRDHSEGQDADRTQRAAPMLASQTGSALLERRLCEARRSAAQLNSPPTHAPAASQAQTSQGMTSLGYGL